MRPILNTKRVSIGATLAMMVVGAAATALPGVSVSSGLAAPARVAEATDGGTIRDGAATDPAQSRNAARSRMRECGHQWSSMKKSGAANGMTWKDFSQGCLARQ